jgi:hypothetical protein
MSKACATVEEAEQTIAHYKKKDGTEAYFKEVTGKFNVYRCSDNKTLKCVNYSPASLKTIVEREEVSVDVASTKATSLVQLATPETSQL